MPNTRSIDDLYARRGNVAPILSAALAYPAVPRLIALSGRQIRTIDGITDDNYLDVVLGLDAYGDMAPREGLNACQRFIQFHGNILDVPAHYVALIDLADPLKPVANADAIMDVIRGIADHFGVDVEDLTLKDVVSFSAHALTELLGTNVGVGEDIEKPFGDKVKTVHRMNGIDYLVIELRSWCNLELAVNESLVSV
jgi:hypothetical protein